MDKILIVEDSDTRQDFFREVLAEFDLTFSTTSAAAIDLLEEKIFDLIFLDMDLDDGLARGLDVARKLKETPNAYADVVVHSMNISVAAEVKRIVPGSQLLSIVEMRRIVARLGQKGLIERIVG